MSAVSCLRKEVANILERELRHRSKRGVSSKPNNRRNSNTALMYRNTRLNKILIVSWSKRQYCDFYRHKRENCENQEALVTVGEFEKSGLFTGGHLRHARFATRFNSKRLFVRMR